MPKYSTYVWRMRALRVSDVENEQTGGHHRHRVHQHGAALRHVSLETRHTMLSTTHRNVVMKIHFAGKALKTLLFIFDEIRYRAENIERPMQMYVRFKLLT